MPDRNPTPDLWRRPGALVAAYPVTTVLIVIAAVSAIFLAAPGIDLWTTGLFYRPEGRFFLSREPVLVFLRQTGDIAVISVVAWLFVQLGLKLARPDAPSLVPPNVMIFLLSTLAIGPGLVVNVILKDHWGRPRPRTVDAFGGQLPYVEVWRITDLCARNCSFVAGEASTGVWLMALALVVPPRWRAPTAIVTGIYALVLSVNRIAFGAHFLSDVLLSWALTALVVLLGWRFIIDRPPAWLANDRLEAGLTAFGRRLHGRRA